MEAYPRLQCGTAGPRPLLCSQLTLKCNALTSLRRKNAGHLRIGAQRRRHSQGAVRLVAALPQASRVLGEAATLAVWEQTLGAGDGEQASAEKDGEGHQGLTSGPTWRQLQRAAQSNCRALATSCLTSSVSQCLQSRTAPLGS